MHNGFGCNFVTQLLKGLIDLLDLKLHLHLLPCGSYPGELLGVKFVLEDLLHSQSHPPRRKRKKRMSDDVVEVAELESASNISVSVLSSATTSSGSHAKGLVHPDLLVVKALEKESGCQIVTILVVEIKSGLILSSKNDLQMKKELVSAMHSQDEVFGLLICAGEAALYEMTKDRQKGVLECKSTLLPLITSHPTQYRRLNSSSFIRLLKELLVILAYGKDSICHTV